MAGRKPPEGEAPPKCACGCGGSVGWLSGHGWAKHIKGHNLRGIKLSKDRRKATSDGLKRHFVGKRRRDTEPTGLGVYSTWEFKDARKTLVEGKPCIRCGATKQVCAHHQTPGDDSTIIPLCIPCHRWIHSPGSVGRLPPSDKKAPPCRCGCGEPVAWKPWGGWNTYKNGHSRKGKIRNQERHETPPLCGCGCGGSVTYAPGKGWNAYKRGHRQRVEGSFNPMGRPVFGE